MVILIVVFSIVFSVQTRHDNENDDPFSAINPFFGIHKNYLNLSSMGVYSFIRETSFTFRLCLHNMW